MAVTLEQVRVEIGDEPRWCTAPGLREVLTTMTDGATSTYYLKYRKAILSSLQVWLGNAPAPGVSPAWTPVPAIGGNAPTSTPWNALHDGNEMPLLVFTPTVPPARLILGVRYLVTMFTDADLSVYITSNTRADDGQTLKAIRYATIPVILNDPEKLATRSIGQRHEDVAAWIGAQTALRASLEKEISPSSMMSRPAFAWGSGGSR